MAQSAKWLIVHSTHWYPNFVLTSSTCTKPHPIHPLYCWHHVWGSATKELHQYYHASFFPPTKATYLQSIRAGYLQGYAGLTCKGAEQYITGTKQAIVQGHSKQCKQIFVQQKQTQPAKKWPTTHHIHDRLDGSLLQLCLQQHLFVAPAEGHWYFLRLFCTSLLWPWCQAFPHRLNHLGYEKTMIINKWCKLLLSLQQLLLWQSLMPNWW